MRIDPDTCCDQDLLAAEVRRLRAAIAALADQDATLSVCDGNVTVTMDATLTDDERKALKWAAERAVQIADNEQTKAGRRYFDGHATALLGLLEQLGG